MLRMTVLLSEAGPDHLQCVVVPHEADKATDLELLACRNIQKLIADHLIAKSTKCFVGKGKTFNEAKLSLEIEQSLDPGNFKPQTGEQK